MTIEEMLELGRKEGFEVCCYDDTPEMEVATVWVEQQQNRQFWAFYSGYSIHNLVGICGFDRRDDAARFVDKKNWDAEPGTEELPCCLLAREALLTLLHGKVGERE